MWPFQPENGDFERIAGCHEHGMDRDLRLDDGPRA
jgi:hypothetical protein